MPDSHRLTRAPAALRAAARQRGVLRCLWALAALGGLCGPARGSLGADEPPLPGAPPVPPDAPAQAPEAPGGAPPAWAEQVEGWVRDLASERYEVRERAREQLEAQGTRAPEVLRAHADDPDPEVRRTVRALLARLEKVAEAVPAPAQDLAGIGCVQVRGEGLPLGRVLEELGVALGGQLQVPSDRLGTRLERLPALESEPAFAAIERVAAAAGLVAPEPFDGMGQLVLRAAPPGAQASPSGTAGPVRVRATRVEAARPLGVEGPVTHGLTLELQLAPAVQLVTYRAPRVLRAEDGAGRAWKALAGSDANTTYGVGGDTRRVETRITLERADPDAAERLARLDLLLELRLRSERREAVFEGLDGLPRSQSLPGAEVVLEEAAPAEGRSDSWSLTVACRLDSEVARASVDVWVDLSDGTRRRMLAMGGRSSSSADGRLRLVGRIHGLREGTRPRAARVTWYAREVQGELAVTLADVPLR